MKLDERIKAARAAVGEQFIGGSSGIDEMADALVVAFADAACRAFTPELFTSPPTMWLAPMEATDEMATTIPMNPRLRSGRRLAHFCFNRMRDAYLNRDAAKFNEPGRNPVDGA